LIVSFSIVFFLVGYPVRLFLRVKVYRGFEVKCQPDDKSENSLVSC
jgi:hypothetical protein